MATGRCEDDDEYEEEDDDEYEEEDEEEDDDEYEEEYEEEDDDENEEEDEDSKAPLGKPPETDVDEEAHCSLDNDHDELARLHCHDFIAH